MRIRIKKHILIGIAASIFLLLIYSVVLVLFQGPKHALEQTVKVWYWLLILAASFGTQISLFSFLRQGIRAKKAAVIPSVVLL